MYRTLASALLSALLFSSTALAKKAPPCGSGAWLLVNPAMPDLAEVTLDGKNVSLGTACQAVRGKIKGTAKGTP